MSGLNDVVRNAQQQIDAIEHALGIPQQTPGEGSPPGQANTAPIGTQGGEGSGGAAAPQPAQSSQQGQQQPGQQQGQPQQQQPLPFQAQQDQQGQPAQQQPGQQQIPSEDRKWESMYRTAEQKFQVLQGKYNAEVPRLQHQLRETEQRASTFEAKASTLEQRVGQLEQAMQQGQGQQGQFNQQGQQGQQSKAGQQGTPGANGGFPIDLSGVDFETLAATYPDDLAPMIRLMPQMVQHMQSQEGVIATLQQQLATTAEGMQKVVTNVEQVNAERAGNAQRAFRAELGRICPEWQQIDNMPDFHNWLDQRKPMSVRTYRQDAEEAFRVGDAVAVAECYNAFKSDFLSNQGQRQNGQQQGNVQQPGSQQPYNNQQPPIGSQQQGQGQGQQGSGQQQQPVQGQQGNPRPQTFMQFDEFGQPIYIGPQVNQQGQGQQQFVQGQQGQGQGQQQYVQGQPYNPVEYMIEPSPSAGNPPQAPPQKRIYTIQEITDHNTRMTKNPRLLQDPTWAATEKDMANAVLEGRVAGQLPDMRLQSGEARFVQGI